MGSLWGRLQKRARGSLGVLIAAGLLLGVAGCASGFTASAQEVRSQVPREAGQASAEQIDQFVQIAEGIALGSIENEKLNLAVSPASLQLALGMVALGARGEAKTALDKVVGSSDAAVVNAMERTLHPWAGDPAVVKEKELPKVPVTHVANNVAIDDQADIEQAYLDDIAKNFGAGVLHTDLGTEQGIKPLSAWVKENTGGLIEKSAIEANPDNRLVLQNAIVLAAAWLTPFEKDDTAPREFHTSDGGAVEVDMMRKTDALPYAQAEGWAMAEVPYTQGFTAQFILPPRGSAPNEITDDILSELNAQAVSQRTGESKELVKITVPKISLKTQTDLIPLLEKMGAGIAMSDEADFSGMSKADTLVIGQISQQVVLDIDEDGTKAAAVTEIGMRATSAPVDAFDHELVLDRPYLVIIRAVDTGWPLFVAQVMNPASE
ncbi:MAG: serpin family protein [Actinomycetaceae bacterium]|nr:serpin family protein [Actinomycetaceae bacterium]